MENRVLENAVEDIELIKSVIDKTRKSFSGFSKIFIMWGILYLFMSALTFLQSMNMELTLSIYNEHMYLNYLVPAILFGIGAIIYLKVTKSQPLVGLERHLMVLWILVLIMQLVRMKVELSMDLDLLDGVTSNSGLTQIVTTSSFAHVTYGLGIASVMTGIFTELKNFKIVGLVYVLMALIHSYVGPGSMYDILSSFGYVILPFTLIYTGLYLKRYHERSEVNGTQLDS
ncbi:MAG: hypothetical protein JEZ08_18550 [Clostridiales bacterium]|nr:hypothetical protein [Clostridiales bacterium]